jgi:hypothetical protein
MSKHKQRENLAVVPSADAPVEIITIGEPKAVISEHDRVEPQETAPAVAAAAAAPLETVALAPKNEIVPIGAYAQLCPKLFQRFSLKIHQDFTQSIKQMVASGHTRRDLTDPCKLLVEVDDKKHYVNCYFNDIHLCIPLVVSVSEDKEKRASRINKVQKRALEDIASCIDVCGKIAMHALIGKPLFASVPESTLLGTFFPVSRQMAPPQRSISPSSLESQSPVKPLPLRYLPATPDLWDYS